MVKQNDFIKQEGVVVEGGSVVGENKEGKKAFVEPAISVPVDVLEATTFFQISSSGATN